MGISDVLSVGEFEFSKRAWNALKEVEWAAPLVNRMTDADGNLNENDRFGLFELRFGYALRNKGISRVEYEYKTVDDTSVDFRVETDRIWLIELVSIAKSKAVEAATGPNEDYPFITETVLSSMKAIEERQKCIEANVAEEEMQARVFAAMTQSEEGELIVLQQKIGEKVWRNKRYVKFPPPEDSRATHVIVVDSRSVMDLCADSLDFLEVCVGLAAFNNQEHKLFHSWQGQPIKGIFQKDNAWSGAPAVRERIHLLHFVKEEQADFCDGGIEKSTKLVYPNPWNFATEDERRAIHQLYPFQRQKVSAASGGA